MEEAQIQTGRVPLGLKLKRAVRMVWLVIERLFDILMDALVEYAHIIWREMEVFFGSALLLVGVFGFQNGKNCDGNTADYISCTNPSTFYYYDWLQIAVIVIGVFFIMLWFFKLRNRTAARR